MVSLPCQENGAEQFESWRLGGNAAGPCLEMFRRIMEKKPQSAPQPVTLQSKRTEVQ